MQAFKNAIRELESRIVEKDEEITKQDYTTDLDTKLTNLIFKVMVLESRVDIIGFKLKEAKIMV